MWNRSDRDASGKQEWQKKHCEMICLRLNQTIEGIWGETSMRNYLSIIWNAKWCLPLMDRLVTSRQLLSANALRSSDIPTRLIGTEKQHTLKRS
jgi:hypothetical protein